MAGDRSIDRTARPGREEKRFADAPVRRRAADIGRPENVPAGPKGEPPSADAIETEARDERRMDPATGKAMAIYILYLLTFVTGFTLIIGLVMAYVFKDGASEMEESHYDNAINIFWKNLLYLVIAIPLIVVIVGIPLTLLVTIWFIIRCAKGIAAAADGRPIEKPSAWGF